MVVRRIEKEESVKEEEEEEEEGGRRVFFFVFAERAWLEQKGQERNETCYGGVSLFGFIVGARRVCAWPTASLRVRVMFAFDNTPHLDARETTLFFIGLDPKARAATIRLFRDEVQIGELIFYVISCYSHFISCIIR